MQQLATKATNSEGATGGDDAYSAFTTVFPEYATTHRLDQLRRRDYARLDDQGDVYLDHAGGGLYGRSQLDAHMALLANATFGSPHSENSASRRSALTTNQARSRVLAYFNASPQEYTVIFTPNASGALKLVGESFPFSEGGHYLLTADNHNSVNGIREFARARGAAVTYVPLNAEMRVD